MPYQQRPRAKRKVRLGRTAKIQAAKRRRNTHALRASHFPTLHSRNTHQGQLHEMLVEHDHKKRDGKALHEAVQRYVKMPASKRRRRRRPIIAHTSLQQDVTISDEIHDTVPIYVQDSVIDVVTDEAQDTVPIYAQDAVIEVVTDETQIELEEPNVEVIEPEVIDAPPILEQIPIHKKYTRWQAIVVYALLVLLVSNTLFLWYNVNRTHLYLHALDPGTGKFLTQQDIGTYQGNIQLTAPLNVSSSILVGVHTEETQGTQQVLTLTKNSTTWRVASQFTAPLAHGALSSTPDGHLLVESANGLQILTSDGRLLWQVQSPQPARGIHHFQPASDNQTVYTLNSTQVTAYDLHTGTLRWMRPLNDTVAYAPPLLLEQKALYVASDHNIYALSSSDGSVLWHASYPSRTLLIQDEGLAHLLVSAGPQGLVALDTTTGRPAWSFQGQFSNTQTPIQLYQASIGHTHSSNSNIIYTTGIAWNMLEAQEQVWLYAVQASTGTLLWSQQIASGSITADVGRPLFDAVHETVTLQQELGGTTPQQHIIRMTAFDATTGNALWKTEVTEAVMADSTLVQTADGTLLLFTTVTDSAYLLHTMPLILTLIVLSIVGLLVLSLKRIQWRRIATVFTYALKHSRRLTRKEVAFVLIILVVVGASMVTSVSLQPPNSVYQVNAHSGSVNWRHSVTTPLQPLATDDQGSIVSVEVGDHLRQLQALNPDGTIRWKMFRSEGTFSIPATTPQSGTLLVALSGDSLPNYQVADPAYARPFHHLLVMYLLDRQTGKPLWQNIIVYPDEQQSAVILGADTTYVYVASTHEPGSVASTVQLLAVNETTGTIDWRVFGPTDDTLNDDGKLLLHDGQVIWQVAGMLYSIDATLGQIEWRHFDTARQMAVATGALLVTRDDGLLHALDLSSGDDLWSIPVPTMNAPLTPIGVVAAGSTAVVYRGTQIEGVDVTSHRVLWSQREPRAIRDLTISDDGKLVYTLERSDIVYSPTIVALDIQTGSTRWTFELLVPIRFSSFQYHHGIVFTTFCFSLATSNCTYERLYALNALTGDVLWKIEGISIFNVQMSQDGMSLLFILKAESLL